jgi:hypothetical protein
LATRRSPSSVLTRMVEIARCSLATTSCIRASILVPHLCLSLKGGDGGMQSRHLFGRNWQLSSQAEDLLSLLR